MAIGYPEDYDIKCGIHGPMKYRYPRYLWECVGFDGEGCCVLTDEQVYEFLLGGPAFEPDSPLLPISYQTGQLLPYSSITVRDIRSCPS